MVNMKQENVRALASVSQNVRLCLFPGSRTYHCSTSLYLPAYNYMEPAAILTVPAKYSKDT